MNNIDIINTFYNAFSNGDAHGMTQCYHDDVVFQDAAFGTLIGERARGMWQMLLSSKTAGLDVSFSNIDSYGDTGSAQWVAKYTYGPAKRKVTNHVSAKFKFKDGLIIEHVDTFDLWKWTQQAMGFPGYLLGWSGVMRNKIQKTTNGRLDSFMNKK